MVLEKSTISGQIGFKACAHSSEEWNSKLWGKNNTDRTDWSGFYVGTRESVARGYVADVFPRTWLGKPKEDGIAYINKISISKQLDIYTCKEYATNYDKLTASFKSHFKIDNNQLFMNYLGVVKEAIFRCPANEDGAKTGEYEIAIPCSLIHLVSMSPHRTIDCKTAKTEYDL